MKSNILKIYQKSLIFLFFKNVQIDLNHSIRPNSKPSCQVMLAKHIYVASTTTTPQKTHMNLTVVA